MYNNGVYIGKDIEVVVTDDFIVSYLRNSAEDFLESCLFKKDNSSNKFVCIGICRTSPAASNMDAVPTTWSYAFHDERNVFSSDEQIAQYIGKNLMRYDNGIFSFVNWTNYETVCDENFTFEGISPKPPDICTDNVGECLQSWNMGVTKEIFSIDEIDTFIGVIINTKKHMYIFEMLPNSIYCRAARYKTCTKGVVFNQNFRQGVNAYMFEDNREATKPLTIDDTHFNSEACFWDRRSVYWSVASYSDNQIILNGCQGDTYKWNKPKRE